MSAEQSMGGPGEGRTDRDPESDGVAEGGREEYPRVGGKVRRGNLRRGWGVER